MIFNNKKYIIYLHLILWPFEIENKKGKQISYTFCFSRTLSMIKIACLENPISLSRAPTLSALKTYPVRWKKVKQPISSQNKKLVLIVELPVFDFRLGSHVRWAWVVTGHMAMSIHWHRVIFQLLSITSFQREYSILFKWQVFFTMRVF